MQMPLIFGFSLWLWLAPDTRSCTSLSAALVQFHHVAIRIAHEDSLRPGAEADGAAAQRDTGRLEPFLRGRDVGAQEGKMRYAGMLVGYVHEDVRFVRAWRVEHQIELDSGR